MSEKDKETGEIQTKQSSGSTNFAMRSDLAFPKNLENVYVFKKHFHADCFETNSWDRMHYGSSINGQ